MVRKMGSGVISDSFIYTVLLSRNMGELDTDMYTLFYFKWITNKDLLYTPGNSAQCYVTTQMGKEFEKE